jgi:uncharacterized protein (DUF1919 family)
MLRSIKHKLKNIQNKIKSLSIKLDQKSLGDKEFVIISNNCWGAEIYKRLNKEYNTPFVGLFLFGPDYINLLEKFDYYMSQTLKFTTISKWIDSSVRYPIGKLDDIEIHFMHYENTDEAKSKWNRRLSRMNKIQDKNKYYFKICDRDFTTSDLIKKFHALPFNNKISFGINKINLNAHIVLSENENNKCVPEGLILYKTSFKYIDIFKWIKTGEISSNWYSKMKFVAGIA